MTATAWDNPASKKMRSYLIGDLPDEEKGRLEEHFLSDRACFEKLSALEEELIECYVCGELEKRDREQFERYFMRSPTQRARVERAAVMFRGLEIARRQERGSASTLSRVGRVGARPRYAGQALKFLLAAAAVIIAVTSPWLLVQRARLRAQIQQYESDLRQEREIQQRLREQQQGAKIQIALLSQRLKGLATPQFNSLIVDVYPSSFVRSAASTSDNEVPVPSDARTITLLLHSTTRSSYPTYSLKIVDAANRVVSEGEGLVRQSTGEYIVSLPAELLPPGKYSVHVHAPNPSRRVRVESYRIRIAARPSSMPHRPRLPKE